MIKSFKRIFFSSELSHSSLWLSHLYISQCEVTWQQQGTPQSCDLGHRFTFSSLSDIVLWFGNGRWCSVKLPVNFTSDHSFAIMICAFFPSLFVWILQLCASWNVLCNPGLSYLTWSPWSLTEKMLKYRKKPSVKQKCAGFSWFLFATPFPGRPAEALHKKSPSWISEHSGPQPMGLPHLCTVSCPWWPQDYQNEPD